MLSCFLCFKTSYSPRHLAYAAGRQTKSCGGEGNKANRETSGEKMSDPGEDSRFSNHSVSSSICLPKGQSVKERLGNKHNVVSKGRLKLKTATWFCVGKQKWVEKKERNQNYVSKTRNVTWRLR